MSDIKNHYSDITTGHDSDEGTLPWYRRMFKACEINPGKESLLHSAVTTILSGEKRYLEVEKATKVPAMVLGCLHWKEASCSFKGVLHNGEHIIGTGQKTKLVPKGRGPFSTWEEAAVDAIELNPNRWSKLASGSRDIGEILYACERFNGTGYISGSGRLETSPYLWACSNINDGFGKYTSDGHFDPNATTQKTVGIAPILKELIRLGHFKIEEI